MSQLLLFGEKEGSSGWFQFKELEKKYIENLEEKALLIIPTLASSKIEKLNISGKTTIKTDPQHFTAIFVVSGDVTLTTEDQELSAQKESLVFLHPDMTVSCVCTGKSKKAELVVINVTPAFHR